MVISFENQKECPVCGKIYDEDDNFCSQHTKLVELVYTKDLVKICPKCGAKYREDDNFCSKHSDLVNLVHVDDLVKVCDGCGAKYPKDYNYCVRCEYDKPLTLIVKSPRIMDIKTNPNQFYNFKDYSNSFRDISQLLSADNVKKLEDFNFSQLQFDRILENIKTTYQSILNDLIEEYDIDLNRLKPLEKILLFAKSFVKTGYKEGGGDLGHFEFNEIYVDDRAPDALQITTVIHELSHFLLAEILEQIVSELINTEKTEAVEAFICYNLTKNSLNYLVDEYCAHTVEGRFAVYGYQDYGSYNLALSNFLQEYSEDHAEVAKEIGNTFAFYIKNIMESFIDETLRSEIKEEFKNINDVPNYSGLKHETSVVFEWDRFSKSINIMLTGNIDEFINNPEDMKELKSYAVKFRKNNEG